MSEINLTDYLKLTDKQLAIAYFKLSKLERRQLYSQLPIERQANLRPLIEGRRGIVRNALGKIVKTDEWIKARIKALQTKKDVYTERLEYIDSELANLEAELEEAN